MTNAQSTLHDKNVIRLIDQLYDAIKKYGLGTSFSVPRLVAIGNQSAGKSSLLSFLVNYDIFPKDSTMCTRAPLVLRLVNLKTFKSETKKVTNSGDGDSEFESASEDENNEYAIFEADAEMDFKEKQFDLSDVSAEILRRQQVLVDHYKTPITDHEIKIKLFVNDCYDLTLVDLPGMKSFDSGDKQLPKMIEDMVRKYSI